MEAPLRVVLSLSLLLAGCGARGSPRIQIAIFRGEELTQLTKALGHFEQEGLDVEVHELASSAKAMEALFGGSVEVVGGGYDHVVRLAADGRTAKSFMVLADRSPLALVASPKSPSIRSVADLKGRTIAVSSFGSSGNFFVNLLLVRNGLPLSDAKIVATGGGHAVTVAWAEQGQADAIVTLPASLSVLRSRHSNLVILANGTTPEGSRAIFGVDAYPALSLIAQDSWLKANPAAARGITRAMRRTLQWVKQHSAREFQAALRGSSAQAEELEGLRAAMATSSRDGRMPAGGPEAVRDAVAISSPEARSVDLNATYTNEYLPD